ncbi:uncharacterized protein LOC134216378 [Armigeres subalbatus]|uniref:uncharacterized protein LOC134216378 n=1 Tax=Armigeres subalbatus TaxID=124917 RepID=UPI002ED5D738
MQSTWSKMVSRGQEKETDPNDCVSFEYKGRTITMSRQEYERPFTKQEIELSKYHKSDGNILLKSTVDSRTKPSALNHSKPNQSSNAKRLQPCSSTYPSSTTLTQKETNGMDESLEYFENLERKFRQSLNVPQTTMAEELSSKKNDENKIHSEDNIFTLDDLIESKETVIEHPNTSKPSLQNTIASDIYEPSSTTNIADATSIDSMKVRKSEEVTVKLVQLKSKVVNLIDQTISQIESGENLSKPPVLHPSGDGSTLDHRAQNFEVFKTDSFIRSRKEIRTRLYREIRTVLKRLEDLDKLE